MGGNSSSHHVSLDDEADGITFVKGIRVSVLDNNKLAKKSFSFSLLSNYNYIISIVNAKLSLVRAYYSFNDSDFDIVISCKLHAMHCLWRFYRCRTKCTPVHVM